MLDKIKAEIDEVTEAGDGEYGCIEAYELCIKWAEELEINVTSICLDSMSGGCDASIIEKRLNEAFHGEKNVR